MPVVINGTTGVNTDGQGNLTFSGTGQRITGDFSTATIANRVAFQTSTVNGQTIPVAFPNGTSGVAGFAANSSSSDPANASEMIAAVVGGSDVRFTSGIRGTGTFLPMTFYAGGSERMRLDTSGNLGIGVAPSAWGAVLKAIQVGARGSLSYATGGTVVGQNYFSDGSSAKYIQTAAASALSLETDGSFKFFTAASGTAGNAISFTQAMTLDASGNLGVGTSSPSARVHSYVGSAAQINNLIQNTVSYLNYGVFADGNNYVYSGTATNLLLGTNNAERMRIDSSGNVGIGTSSPGNKLQVAGRISLSYQNATNADAGLDLVDSGNNGGNSIRWLDSGGYVANISQYSSSHATLAGVMTTNNGGGYRFSVNGSERMRIDSSGNLLVNTTTNANSSRLVVNGVIESTSGGIRFPNGSVQTVAAAASSYIGLQAQVFSTSGSFTFTIPSGVTAIKATLVGGGGGGQGVSGCNWAGGTAGGTTSISSGTQTISTVSATGGAGNRTNVGGPGYPIIGGSGSGGSLNINGGTVNGNTSGWGGTSFLSSTAGNTAGNLGSGGWGQGGAGAAGGAAIRYLTGLTPGNTISVTVGAGGSGGGNGSAGGAGVVIFEW